MTGGYRKIKLFSLMVALIVAGLAVVGGTWAWGVDYTRGSKEDLLPSDNSEYNVAFQYYSGNDYTAAKATNIFSNISNAAWCPGKTEIIYLKLENNEKFPVSCTLSLEVSNNQFDNVMSYACIKGTDLKAANANHPPKWTEFYSMAQMNPIVLKDGSNILVERQSLSFADTSGDDYYLALAIHMDENASSDYMGKSMSVQLKLQVDANYLPGATPNNPDTSDVKESPQ